MPTTLYWLGEGSYVSDYLIPVEDEADQQVYWDKWGNKCITVKYPVDIGWTDIVGHWLGDIENGYELTVDLWLDGQIDWRDYAELERR